MIVRNPTSQRENHRNGVVRDFILAIVGDIRNRATEFPGYLDVDVINPNTIPDNAADAREAFQNNTRNGGPLHHKYVRFATFLNDLLFSFAIRFNFLECETCGLYDLPLQLYAGKTVVSNDDSRQFIS
jgi:hypothetical protein